MAGRGPYRKYTLMDRQRIVAAYHNGEDWQSVAKVLNVNSRTSLDWVTEAETGEPRKKHGGHCKRKLTETQIDTIVDWLGNDPTMSLHLIKLRVLAEFDIDVCISTIGLYLKCRLVTLKKLHHISETMNSTENKVKRKVYVEQLQGYIQMGMRLVWMDETNFNLHCSRNEGRSVRGTRARITVANSRGSNLHIIGAIDERGFIDYTIKRGSFNKESFQQWLKRLLDVLQEQSNQPAVIICDNAPAHTGAESVFLDPHYIGHKLLRLGPYSPALNPIEGIWSILKSKIKSSMRDGYDQMLRGDPNNILTKQEWRMQFLERIAMDAKYVVLPQH